MIARLFFIAASAILALCLYSCQDPKEEPDVLDSELIDTKLENISEYYWFSGLKIPIEKDYSRCYIAFKGENMDSLLEKLQRDEIEISGISTYDGYDKTQILYTEIGKEWNQDRYYATLEVDYETARKYEEIDRADSYYFLGQGSLDEKIFEIATFKSYPILPVATVQLRRNEDLPILEKKVEELGAHIYCSYPYKHVTGFERLYQVLCNTKNGQNAADVANALEESGVVEYAQPEFKAAEYCGSIK